MSDIGCVELPDHFRDRDIFEDTEGRLFVTLGYIQPRDRVLSYLKYIPDDDGKWIRAGSRYRRVFWGSVDSVVNGTPLLPSAYIVNDSHFQTSLIEPPKHVIKQYYQPENRLVEIIENPKDELEEITKSAAELLHDELKIPLNALGIAGSILWKGHNIAHSDINMNIYGYEQSWRLQRNYEVFDEEKSQIRLRTQAEWVHAIERIHQRIPVLHHEDLQKILERRRALCINTKCIGITPVLFPHEAPIDYGLESYLSISSEPVKLTMTIVNDDYGIFHPALYTTEPVEWIGETVQRILVYDGAFGGLFQNGDRVEVSGILQKVTQKDIGGQINQIMVGTRVGSGKEYIRLVN
jgi:predicted nucleotidyltransferase